jgi:hypothetical protein
MRFTPTTCISIVNINLIREDVEKIYELISFIENLKSHDLLKYPNL